MDRKFLLAGAVLAAAIALTVLLNPGITGFAFFLVFNDAPRVGTQYLFEGFEGMDLANSTEWVVESVHGGGIAIAGDAAHEGSAGMRFEGNGNGFSRVYTEVVGDEVDAFVFVRTSEMTDRLDAAFQLRSQNVVVAEVNIHGREIECLRRDNARGPKLRPFEHLPENNTWYGFRIKYSKPANLVSYYLYNADHQLIESIADRQAYNQLSIDAVTFEMNESTSTTDWDSLDVFVA
ncbi:MAG: hypothetical protein JW744_00145 [Candidatus Diapherotrites archaeon]|uniref:Uncharacterized protein n=1 Tax=Candidatus Iainarchaeum sp. TaxID=3101447 RepID=A0A938YSV2_9ARCH|nr:hypothetical protein [Candidatus Diapherotrites archaeon]